MVYAAAALKANRTALSLAWSIPDAAYMQVSYHKPNALNNYSERKKKKQTNNMSEQQPATTSRLIGKLPLTWAQPWFPHPC